jgi:hypothetical protein
MSESNKEITFLTCQAKVETEDKTDDELYNKVHEKSSPQALEVLESIAQQGKAFAESPMPELRQNGKSEALKVYIKSLN